MINPVENRNRGKIERAYIPEAGDIDAILPRVRPSLMMRIDTASGAKKVFGGFRVELINGQQILPFDDRNPVERRRNRNSAAHAAIGTIASPYATQAVGKRHAELHRPTMA